MENKGIYIYIFIYKMSFTYCLLLKLWNSQLSLISWRELTIIIDQCRKVFVVELKKYLNKKMDSPTLFGISGDSQ